VYRPLGNWECVIGTEHVSWTYLVPLQLGNTFLPLSITQHYPPLKLHISTERESKKRKTRSGCSRVELISALRPQPSTSFRILGIKTEDVELDDSNPESFEEMEVDNDALAQLDGLLEWMDSKTESRYKVQKKYVLGRLLDISDFAPGPEPHVLVRQLDDRERHPDYRETTTISQR